MTLVILIVAAMLTLALTAGLAVSRALRPASKTDLAAKLEPIDVVAFRNLIDPAEDVYLRRHLSAAQFRLTQRARLSARAAYVRVAGRNAAVLIRMGQTALATSDARATTDARVREAALQLVNEALLLRRNAAFALLRIYADMAWPSQSAAPAGIIDRYERLSDSAMLLGRLRNPGVAVRVMVG
ncbi:MAG: hypothetical protein WBQ08_11135 [Candidatus Sulfotelmatobacter sp.]